MDNGSSLHCILSAYIVQEVISYGKSLLDLTKNFSFNILIILFWNVCLMVESSCVNKSRNGFASIWLLRKWDCGARFLLLSSSWNEGRNQIKSFLTCKNSKMDCRVSIKVFYVNTGFLLKRFKSTKIMITKYDKFFITSKCTNNVPNSRPNSRCAQCIDNRLHSHYRFILAKK